MGSAIVATLHRIKGEINTEGEMTIALSQVEGNPICRPKIMAYRETKLSDS